MWALLFAQLTFAAALVWLDYSSIGPGDISVAVEPMSPIEPGDQVRRYDPNSVPARPGVDRGRGAPRDGMIALPDGMTSLAFRFVDGSPEGFGRIMAVEGAIAPGDADRFAAAFADATASGEDAPQTIALHSPGGSLADALSIGKIIRDAGVATLVADGAACISACPTMLFGGEERYVSRNAWVGMHQSYLADVTMVTTRRAVAEVQRLQGEVIAFTRGAGVDPGVHVHALTTPPEDVYFLIPEELEEYKVATRLID